MSGFSDVDLKELKEHVNEHPPVYWIGIVSGLGSMKFSLNDLLSRLSAAEEYAHAMRQGRPTWYPQLYKAWLALKGGAGK